MSSTSVFSFVHCCSLSFQMTTTRNWWITTTWKTDFFSFNIYIGCLFDRNFTSLSWSNQLITCFAAQFQGQKSWSAVCSGLFNGPIPITEQTCCVRFNLGRKIKLLEKIAEALWRNLLVVIWKLSRQSSIVEIMQEGIRDLN